MRKTILTALALTFGLSGSALAADMVFTSWGGTTQDAQKAAWADKFTAAAGVNVLQDGPTDYGKIKAMVEAGSVTWDVVDVEGDYAVQAGKQRPARTARLLGDRQVEARSTLRHRPQRRQLLLSPS